MQEWYLGLEKVSCLERCPQFRSVLIEREVPLAIYQRERERVTSDLKVSCRELWREREMERKKPWTAEQA